VYYEDVYGYKNADEELEGVHILDSESDSGSDSESDSEPEISSRRGKSQARKETRVTQDSDTSTHSNEQAMESLKQQKEFGIPHVDRSTGKKRKFASSRWVAC